MKTRIFILAALLTSLVSCNAQEKKEKGTDEPLTADATTEQTTPKGNWKVNKQFDENGNLVQYDSIFTYGFSTEDGDTLPLKTGRNVMKSFHQYFGNTQMPQDFMNHFFSDSLNPGENPFDENFFNNRMFSDDFQEQLQKMDSIRNAFMQQYQQQLSGPEHTPQKT